MKFVASGVFVAAAMLGLGAFSAHAQLFENLRVLGGTRYLVGDPSVTATNLQGLAVEGPKDIAVADLDGDGKPDFAASNKDGSVTVRYGDGDGKFTDVQHLRTWVDVPADLVTFYFTNHYTNTYCDYQPTNFTLNCYDVITPPLPGSSEFFTNRVCLTNYEYGCVGMLTNVYTNIVVVEGPIGLRGLALADFTGDGQRDIAVASPGESLIYVFANAGARSFSSPIQLAGWLGVRDLAAGDFDGDGQVDLAAAGTTNGLVQFRSLGGGAFEIVTNILTLRSDPIAGSDDADYEFPQPAYYLRAVRQPGDDRDELVASFAQRGKIWILRAGAEGRLGIAGDVENVSLTALDAAPLLQPATNGAPPDLITAYSRGGNLNIFPATNLTQRFSGRAARNYYVPGAPRNVRIADLDGDGWNDVVVVAQRTDRVLTYRNDSGNLTLIAESFVGRGPREMDLGDFNADGHPDLAVLNRQSMDVSILITSTNTSAPVGFLALDSIYPVDGGVSGLDLRDFNGDDRPDVMQLHRDTSEFSVRLTQPDGRLAPPTFYAITNGFHPAAQIAADVNGDGLTDMVSANMSGSITVRLGQSDGTFGPEQTFILPDDGNNGRLMAITAGDLDNDGKMDLAAAYWDCRMSMFKGDGTGHFTFIRTDPLIYEPRSLACGDFDQDGDLDIVGASIVTSLGFVIVENKGDLFTTPELTKRNYPLSDSYLGNNMLIVDQNNDGDPDLLFGSPGGFALFVGGPGLTFIPIPIDNGGNDPNLAASTFVFADLDGDGDNDIASVCGSNTCLTIQVYTGSQYVTALTVPVPVTRFLATGDLDGDGFADLVGSGDVLWVALSSRAASNAPPTELLGGRSDSGVVINEVLSSNTSLPVAADGDRLSDWTEIYNGSLQPVPLFGWRLMLVRTNVFTFVVTNDNQLVVVTNSFVSSNLFTFPNDAPLPPGGHRVLVCSDRLRTVYHTGFTLPAEGGMLCLFNVQGDEVNRVSYPATDPDLSYARYTDGARVFVVNNIPSPGAANVDNGAVNPELTFRGVDIETLSPPGQPLRFRATATDDVGVMNVSLLWRRLDIPDNVTKRVILYDDGMNEDGPMNDGQFMGVLNDALPAGATIQFYLECTDITDETETSPGNPIFVAAGQRPRMHSLAIGAPRPPLEISEIVAFNSSGLTDERGGRPDWVEIRNTSSNTVSLAGVTLGPKIFGDGERLNFTNRPSIGPGEHIVIYADNNPNQGQLHAPFRLNRLGEQLVLTGTTAGGARFVIDAVTYGPQSPDTAFSRLGGGGPWVTGPPTPRGGNVAGPWRAVVRPDGFLLAFPTRAGRTYTVEHTGWLGMGIWFPMTPARSVGLEQTAQLPLLPQWFFRVRED